MKDWSKVRPRIPRWLAGLLVVGLVAGGGYIAYGQVTANQRQESRRRVQTASVERLNLPVTISANGTVQPERSVNVSPKSSGILRELLVQEGDRVQEGQILAYMDASNLEGQLTQAKGQVASAIANLNKAQAGNRTQDIAQAEARVRDAEAALRQANQTLGQNQQLVSQGALNQREYNNSLAERDRAQAQLDQAKQALSLQQAGSRPEDIAAAQADVTRAEGQQQVIESQINDTIIRAPFSGTVTRKFADPGSFVTPTTSGSSVSSATSSSILSLASRNQVIAKVAEANISQIKLGQTVKISADAYPGQSFSGRVSQIATQSTIDQNVTNFEVKIAIADPQRQLRAGMNVNAEFEVGTLDNALVVPTVAIVRQQRGTGVYVVGQGEKQRPQFKPITTGATVGDKTVVLSGANVGDRVLLSFPQGERPAGSGGPPGLFPGAGGGSQRSGGPGGGGAGGAGGGNRRSGG